MTIKKGQNKLQITNRNKKSWDSKTDRKYISNTDALFTSRLSKEDDYQVKLT